MNKAGETILRLRSEKRKLEEQIANDHRVKALKKQVHARNQLVRDLEKELKQLRSRTSPATEPCACPAYCTYHARERFETFFNLLKEARGFRSIPVNNSESGDWMRRVVAAMDGGCGKCGGDHRPELTCQERIGG